ncbi:ABC transporter permease subunit [Mycoplasma zalophidermidis]|uniref:ABC transporter permease subunit n=1 Tax=Mycoplasma zalophidermidis TaxID=398174 RepID=A0ABS6DS85_9MOLU|nr:ABC transporter permease subunit [Mycoplasma zalophidermidis]MBU4693879.1 ABC transporter permease subunit [Mycoplasma zalophidermidis]
MLLIHWTLGYSLVPNYQTNFGLEFLKSILSFNYGNIEVNSSSISVFHVYVPYFNFTLFVVLISFVISFGIGFVISYKLAKNNKNAITGSLNIIIFIFSSIPIFILGPIAISFNKWVGLPSIYIDTYFNNFWLTFLSLIVPILILTIVITPLVVAINYPILKEILQSEYYTWSRANGFSQYKIFVTVVLRNWIAKVLQNIVLFYIFLMTYAMIIERFFYAPGQSFIFQYLGQPQYFNLLMFSILINISVIGLIKAVCDLSTYFLDTSKIVKNYRIGGVKWNK